MLYNVCELCRKWEKSKKFGAEEPSDTTLKSYHASNSLGMILLCPGAVNCHIYLKLGCRVTTM